MFSPEKGEGREDKEMLKTGERRKGKFAIKSLRVSSFLKFLGLFRFRFFCLFYLTFPHKTSLTDLEVELEQHTENP